MIFKPSVVVQPKSDYFIALLGKWDIRLIPDVFHLFLDDDAVNKIKSHKEVFVTAGKQTLGIFIPDLKQEKKLLLENIRRYSAKFPKNEKNNGTYSVIYNAPINESHLEELCIALGLNLYSYDYFLTKKEKSNENPIVYAPLSPDRLKRISDIVNSVYLCRDWVNHPANHLNAPKLAKEFQKIAKIAPVKVTVLKKKEIEKLKMGGLLAVNQGSVDEPRFSILEYKPKNAKNKKPIVLVGKGLVYDTGGLSLKPTPGSMDSMKCDMAGGAVVAAAVCAVARLRLPKHVIALVPSTDNRPGFNAFAPGDIIRMMDGSTVEMLNSDAEGRMILADALHFAKKYSPEIVLEFSTLTGAAANAIGIYGMVGMGDVSDKQKKKIFESADKTGERIAEFPFWSDYDELLKSDIADCKNIGGPVAGAITAGRFLKKFTDYPFYHFDIAAPAFIQNKFHYLPKGGTGFGVRFLVDFIENY
ncbi:MAG: peptidase M17 [Bacteroidia bacterium]|nr:peptidase M17 [Bacteroidia bacterium]